LVLSGAEETFVSQKRGPVSSATLSDLFATFACNVGLFVSLARPQRLRHKSSRARTEQGALQSVKPTTFFSGGQTFTTPAVDFFLNNFSFGFCYTAGAFQATAWLKWFDFRGVIHHAMIHKDKSDLHPGFPFERLGYALRDPSWRADD
jgi:hypothetical protein